MHSFKFLSMSLATAGMLLVAFSFARGSDHEDDLLDPSLDGPLPQYKSTSDQAFRAIPKATVSVPEVPAKPALKTKSIPPPAPVPGGSRGTMLAPNPLQSLLSGEEPQQRSPIIEKKSVAEPGKLAPPPEYSSPFNPKPLVPPSLQVRAAEPSKIQPPAKPSKLKQQKQKPKEKKAKSAPRKPTLNYNIYRDQSVYPLDPRKANNPCTQTQDCGCSRCLAGKTGIYGRPYQPREPGGYACGKNCSNKRPQFSVYWPRPISAKLDERNPECAEARYSGCPQKKLTDCFDRLVNFRLIDYQRTDNGYCGPGSDPYGCLGESKIANLGYHFQTEAIPQSVQQTIPQASSWPLR